MICYCNEQCNDEQDKAAPAPAVEETDSLIVPNLMMLKKVTSKMATKTLQNGFA